MKSETSNITLTTNRIKKVLVDNPKLKVIDHISKPKQINKRIVLMGIAKGIDGLVVEQSTMQKT